MGLCLIFHVGSPDGKFQCSLPLILVYIYMQFLFQKKYMQFLKSCSIITSRGLLRARRYNLSTSLYRKNYLCSLKKLFNSLLISDKKIV